MITVSKEGSFDEMIAEAGPIIRVIAERLRALIEKAHPEAVEVVWMRQKIAGYGVGPKKMSEQYCYIGLFKKHVNLGFYYGTSLPDPDKLLEGSGKSLRHVKMQSLADVDQQAVAELIQAAINERVAALA